MKISQVNDTPFQLKLPVEMTEIIEMNDPAYTFCEVIRHIDLSQYLVQEGSKTDIRFLWILNGTPAPCFMTIDNFMNHTLKQPIQQIFQDINSYIFEQEYVDLNHV